MASVVFAKKRVVLGVTGSIACYKSADLASKLTQQGAYVDTVLTEAAENFISPLTFQSVTGRHAYTDEDLWGTEGHIVHIGLANEAELLLVAPASAHTIAKLAHGMSDNLLTLTVLASTAPLLVAPAMDGGMYDHPATQANLKTLRNRGVEILGPAMGHLASGGRGLGRMLEPADLLGHVRLALARDGKMAGRRVVVTAGGTQEPIDPVRVITNRSSGRQGFALAQAAVDMGADVHLISGPSSLQTPVGVKRTNVATAQEMLDAVMEAGKEADVLLMAAAVADFRPIQSSEHKIKKGGGAPEIVLEPTPDILEAVATLKEKEQCPLVTVGFAAESQDLEENARAKLVAKKLDLIVANDITAPDSGFEVDTNRVTLLFVGGRAEVLPLLSKYEVAWTVLERVEGMLATREGC